MKQNDLPNRLSPEGNEQNLLPYSRAVQGIIATAGIKADCVETMPPENEGDSEKRIAIVSKPPFVLKIMDDTKYMPPEIIKLLLFAIQEWAKNEELMQRERKGIKIHINSPYVTIQLVAYLSICGYDVIPHDDSKEERKRIDKVIQRHRERLKKWITWLTHSTITIPVDRDNEHSRIIPILVDTIVGRDGGFDQRGNLTLAFHDKFIDDLIKTPQILSYPSSIYQIDTHYHPNALKLAMALHEHFNMVSNKVAETHNRLSIRSLIKRCSYPSIEKVRALHNSWQQKIQEAFERDMAYLSELGFFVKKNKFDYGWNYLNGDFATYETWINTIIEFEIAHPADVSEAVDSRKRILKKIKNAKEKKEVEKILKSQKY